MNSRFITLALLVFGLLVSYNEILEAKSNRLARRYAEEESQYDRPSRSQKSERRVSRNSGERSYRGNRAPANYADNDSNANANEDRSYRGNRRPASSGSLVRTKVGATKAFYGSNFYSQIIGFNLGFSKDSLQAPGYSVTGSYNLFDHDVSAARVDFNGTYGLDRQLSLIGGLNFNQFLGKYMNNIQPDIGFQFGIDLRIDSKWGMQIDYHNIRGAASTGYGTGEFSATAFEVSAYINF